MSRAEISEFIINLLYTLIDPNVLNPINSVVFTISIAGALIGLMLYRMSSAWTKRAISLFYIDLIIAFAFSELLIFSNKHNVLSGVLVGIFISSSVVIWRFVRHKSCSLLFLASLCLLVPYLTNMQYTDMGYGIFTKWIE